MTRMQKINFLNKILSGKATVDELNIYQNMPRCKTTVWNRDGEMYVSNDGQRLSEEEFKNKPKRAITEFNIIIVPPVEDDF